MIDKKFVNKIVKQVLHKGGGKITDRRIMHPEREWSVGLVAGLIMLGAVGFWNINTYMQYKDISISGEGELAGVVVYRESLVEGALEDFEKRSQKYESLKRELTMVKTTTMSNASTSENVSVVEAQDESGTDAGAVVEENDTGSSVDEELPEDGQNVSDLEEGDVELGAESSGSFGGGNIEDGTENNEMISPESDQGKPEMAF